MGYGNKKCCALPAWLFLIAGAGFLIADLSTWNFWGLNWYTVLFLILGVAGVAKSHCGGCLEECKMPASSTKTKKKRR